MRYFLFLLLFSSLLIAENIDERKTDIYFANGVGAMSRGASFEQGELEYDNYITTNLQMEKFVGKYDLAFNTGRGVIPDYFEAWLQYTDENPDAKIGWDAFKTFLGKVPVVGKGASYAVKISEAVIRYFEAEDISIQVEAYEKSIILGHGVLVLAHSQGNFFTNKAYNSDGGITPWMRKYFKSIGLASPSSNKIPNSWYFTYDNDPIHVLNGAGTIVSNPMRHYYWIAEENVYTDITTTVPCAPLNLPKGEQPICHDSDWTDVESDSNDFHIFDYYMQTSATQIDIYNYITDAIELHYSVSTPSQWKKDKEFGCACEKRISVVHKEDSILDILLEKEKVLSFDDAGKIYKLDNKYVKAKFNGDEVLENDALDVCCDLKDSEDAVISQIFGDDIIPNVTRGAIEVTLSWDNGANYDLTLDMPNSIKDVESCKMEHIYVKSEYEIYPGKYAINVTRASSDDVNGTYMVSIKTPSVAEVLSVDANNTGHIADINVKYIDDEPVVSLNHTQIPKVVFTNSSGSGSGGGGGCIFCSGGGGYSIDDGNGSNNYNENNTKERYGYSCGNRPCEYWITSYLSMAMAGPLSGADISLYDLEGFRTQTALYSGKTSIGNTIYTAGRLNIPQEKIDLLDEASLYIITVYGGLDIDADDDMKVDVVPTQNHGTLHAIVSGKELKELQPKVNILTEVAYQVLKDSIQNSSLSDEQIVNKLDDIASRLLLAKVYPKSHEELGNVDLLEWMPTTDRAILHTSYDKKVKPIVESLLLGDDIYQSAYNLVYMPDGVVPILESSIYTVSEGDSIGKNLGDVIVQYEGNSSIESMELYGEGSENFSVNKYGSITLVNTLDYESKQSYKLFVRALNADGYSKYTAIYVEVTDVIDAPYVISFNFESVYEDMPLGSEVGQIVFEKGSSEITSMYLIGDDSSYFSIDTNGTIRTDKVFEDFFVKKVYLFEVVAANDLGASLPVSVVINVEDRRDIPNIDNIYTSLNENTKADTIVAKVKVISDGDSPIVSYTLSDNSHFTIDNNGTVRVAEGAILDYEMTDSITLSVIATNIIGDSRAREVIVRLNNISDVAPVLSDINISINKETAVGTTIGNIIQDSGDSAISSMVVSPTSFFEIGLNGDVKVSENLLAQDNDTFILEVKAINSFGESNSVNVNISLITGLKVEDSSFIIYDNTVSGSDIGQLNIINNGQEISSITLSGQGSNDFQIDKTGVIKVSEGIALQTSRQDFYQLEVLIDNTNKAIITIKILDRIISSLMISDRPRDISISKDNSRIYIAFQGDIESGMQVIDINDSVNPITIGTFFDNRSSRGISLNTSNSKAYISTGGLLVYDILDNKINQTGEFMPLEYYTYKVTLSKDETKVFVPSINSIHIVDISNPFSPTIISSISTSSDTDSIVLSEDEKTLYVPNGYSGLLVVDITNLHAPIIVNTINLSNYTRSVQVSHDKSKLFVNNNQLTILDLNASSPFIIGSLNIGSIQDMELSENGKKLYLVQNNSRVYIIDISDLTSPIAIGSIKINDYLDKLITASDDTKAYVTSDTKMYTLNITGYKTTQKAPGIIGFSTEIDENTSVGSIVGEIKVYYEGDSGINSLGLEGNGSENFSIDVNGMVRLEKGLDYYSNNTYTFKAIATNSMGKKEVDITIYIQQPILE